MDIIKDSNVKIFDRSELLKRLCDDEELLGEVVTIFLEDTPNQIASLKSAQDSGDNETVAMQGHTIKGSSSNVAALRMRELAFAIEKAGKNGDINIVPSLVEQLELSFLEFEKAYKN